MVLRNVAEKSKSFCCSPSAAAVRKYSGLEKRREKSFILIVLETECPKPVSTTDLVFGSREGLLAAGIRMEGTCGRAHFEGQEARETQELYEVWD